MSRRPTPAPLPGVALSQSAVTGVRDDLENSVDDTFTIHEAVACSDGVPYPGYCDTIGPVYGKLVGLNLVRGFRRTIGEMFADVRGCSHMTELLNSLPTAAIQTVASFRRDDEETKDKPFQLDRCHALETSAEAVRIYYPRWYRKPSMPS